MNIPEIFKYNSLISVALFSIISLSLIKRTKDFSFFKHTISKSILFLKHPIHTLIFRLNFLIKALLDLGFAWYISDYFKVSPLSPIFISISLSALLFGSLSYYIEGRYSTIHKIITYSSGIFWSIGMFYIGQLTGNNFFIHLTNIAILAPLILTFSYLFVKKTNIFVQALCMSVYYVWFLILVFG